MISILCLVSVVGDAETVSGKGNKGEVEIRIAASRRLLDAFEKEKSTEDLHKAVRELELAPSPDEFSPVDRVVPRRTQAELWLNILSTIEGNIDTSYDPGDARNAVAVSMPAPIKPDAKEEAAYVAAVKRNDSNIRRLNFQTEIRNEDRYLLIVVAQYFLNNYAATNSDEDECLELVKSSAVRASTKQRLKSSIETRKLDQAD